MEFALLKIMKFEFIGNLYKDKSLLSRVELHAYRKKYRVYYHLPDGTYSYYYSVPDLKNKKEKDTFLAEFRYALASGFLPRAGAELLRRKSFDPKIGTFEIFFKKYFNEYATGERSKLDESKNTQKTVSRAVTAYFLNKNIDSVCQITNEHLKDWDTDLLIRLNKRTGELLEGSTRNSYRKCFRAFLNTAKDHSYPLQCAPDKMNIFEYTKGGEIDEKADVRQVIYPLALIEAVEKCSYPLDLEREPDMRRIIRLWREIGPRTGEMLSFGECNVELKDGMPLNLNIKELQTIKFTPKTEISKRPIPLTDSGSDYILSLLQKFEGVKRYGKVKNEIVEFPFLFVFKDSNGNWVRNDAKFKKLFKKITQHAIQEFNLPYTEKYIPYDLRRSCNLYLRKDRGMEISQAANFLGHSEETNKKHYTLDEDNGDINKAQIQNALMASMRVNPETEKLYSRHFQKETPKTSLVLATQKIQSNFSQNLSIELECLENKLSSIESSGFIIMKAQVSADEEKIL
ncbi:MAG: hypothetical protein PHY93_08555 [Bacteriovorax sp.]|nr:hypothetical protein [Bacteriovorax sp.]